jgi:hypothetical protein
MPFTLTPPQDLQPASLLDRLNRVRLRFRALTFVRGVSQILCFVLVFVALAAFLDWRYNLPPLLRALGLVSVLSVSGILYYRLLVRPYRSVGKLLTVALRIEDKFPDLKDSLASAVQFLEIPEDESEQSSPHLRRETIEVAEDLCADLNFNEAVRRRGTKRWCFVAFLLTAGAGWLIYSAPGPVGISLDRLARPFDAIPWPTKTQIEILEPQPLPARLARGTSLELKVALHGVIPDRVKLVHAPEGAAPQEQSYSVPNVEAGSGSSLFTLRIDGQRVSRNFRFQIKANDAETPWYSIVVQPAPILVPLDGRPSPRIHLDYPAYTELEPVDLPDATSVVEAPAGTLLTMRAATDRPVVKAALEYQPEHTRLITASFLAPLGSSNAAGVAGAYRLSRDVWEPVELKISGAGQVIECAFIPRLPGPYLLKFEDETGLAGTRLFDLRIQPDPVPQVTLNRPAASKDSLMVLPTAEITLQAIATDKLFGLKDVFIEYRIGQTGTMRREPIFDAVVAGKLLPAVGLLMRGPIPIPLVESSKFQSFEIDQRINLQRFRHADGSSLKEGDVLILRVAATDFDTVNPIKLPGRSHEIELQIVGRSQLEGVVQQALANLRGELLQIKEMEREARTKVQEAIKQQRQSGNLRDEDKDKLQQAEQLQQQIRARIQAPEDGLLADAAKLKQMVKDNQLGKSQATERIDTVLGELNRLAAEEFDPIEQALAEAKKNNPGKEKSPLAKAERGQREVEDTLKSLLDKLEPWSGAGEVRGEARSILGELNKQLDQTQQLKDQQKAGMSGTSREQLTPEQQAELDKAALRPDRTGDRARQLIEKIDRLAVEKKGTLKEKEDLLQKKEAEAKKAEEEAKKQPDGSEEQKAARQRANDLRDEADDIRQNRDALKAEMEALTKSIEESNSQTLKQQLQNVGEQVRQNRLESAIQNQQAGIANLQKLIDALEEKPQSAAEDMLGKKRAEAGNQLDKLIDKQDLLQKKIEATKKITDPEKQRDELQKLMREQEQIRQETEELAQKLTRAQADGAAQDLRKAARQMEGARQQLEQGERPEREQDEALDRLEDAEKRLEEMRAADDTELLREKLIKMADLIRAIRERQHTALTETKRLQDGVKKAAGWANEKSGAVLRTNLNNIIEQQEGLSKELDGLVEKRFRGVPVFERMLKHSIDAMGQAAQRLKARKEDALDQVDGAVAFDEDVEKKAFAGIQSNQQLALKRLDQLLEALKPDKEILQAQKPPEQQNPMPMQKPMGKMGDGDNLPPLAQLKALRALQVDLEERTAAFDKAHPDSTQLTEDEAADLKALQEAQEDVAKLIKELTSNSPMGDTP